MLTQSLLLFLFFIIYVFIISVSGVRLPGLAVPVKYKIVFHLVYSSVSDVRRAMPLFNITR